MCLARAASCHGLKLRAFGLFNGFARALPLTPISFALATLKLSELNCINRHGGHLINVDSHFAKLTLELSLIAQWLCMKKFYYPTMHKA